MSSQAIAVPRPAIHHAAALRVVQASIAKAESLDVSVCVAVVDSGGHLAAFARMPGAFLISNELAISKAHSAASIGASAEIVEQILSQEAPRVREGLLFGGVSFIRGGLPLRFEDQLIAAIGGSGGSEAQDVACAEAGVAALGE